MGAWHLKLTLCFQVSPVALTGTPLANVRLLREGLGAGDVR